METVLSRILDIFDGTLKKIHKLISGDVSYIYMTIGESFNDLMIKTVLIVVNTDYFNLMIEVLFVRRLKFVQLM